MTFVFWLCLASFALGALVGVVLMAALNLASHFDAKDEELFDLTGKEKLP